MRPLLAICLWFMSAEYLRAQCYDQGGRPIRCPIGSEISLPRVSAQVDLGHWRRPAIVEESVRENLGAYRPPMLIGESFRNIVAEGYPIEPTGPGRDFQYVGIPEHGSIPNIRIHREEYTGRSPEGILRREPRLRIEYMGYPPVREIALDGVVWRRIDGGR